MSVVKAIGKGLAVWLALVIGQILGGVLGMVLLHPPAQAVGDGPLDATQAMVIICAAFAIVLSLMASRLRGGYVVRALTLFVVLFSVASVQSLIEALYFNAYLKLPLATLELGAVSVGIQSATAALVAAGLWRGVDAPADSFSALGWRFGCIACLYVVVYFAAGALIAWQGAALRTYYAQGMHIDSQQLAGLQILRGLYWAGLAFIAVRQMTGATWLRALLVGLAFAVFMAIQLFYPSGFMPWDVRKMHLMEVFSSNLLFGIAAGWILLSGVRAKK